MNSDHKLFSLISYHSDDHNLAQSSISPSCSTFIQSPLCYIISSLHHPQDGCKTNSYCRAEKLRACRKEVCMMETVKPLQKIEQAISACKHQKKHIQRGSG